MAKYRQSASGQQTNGGETRMGVARKNSDDGPKRKFAPAVDPEARENQLIGMAVDAAERELMRDHPSNQVVLHYLKLATTKVQLEKEKLRKENLLLEAKADAIKSAARSEELYTRAIEAMRIYSGSLNRGDDI